MCKLAACTTDNTSYAIDYEQERKLAACTTDYTSYATVIAPAIDNATDCATMSVQACSMHHRQRHHKSTSIQLRHRQHQQRHRLRTRAPASSYAIDNTKITTQLGWAPKHTFETGMASTIEWYLSHGEWMDKIVSGAYMSYYEKMYANNKL